MALFEQMQSFKSRYYSLIAGANIKSKNYDELKNGLQALNNSLNFSFNFKRNNFDPKDPEIIQEKAFIALMLIATEYELAVLENRNISVDFYVNNAVKQLYKQHYKYLLNVGGNNPNTLFNTLSSMQLQDFDPEKLPDVDIDRELESLVRDYDKSHRGTVRDKEDKEIKASEDRIETYGQWIFPHIETREAIKFAVRFFKAYPNVAAEDFKKYEELFKSENAKPPALSKTQATIIARTVNSPNVRFKEFLEVADHTGEDIYNGAVLIKYIEQPSARYRKLHQQTARNGLDALSANKFTKLVQKLNIRSTSGAEDDLHKEREVEELVKYPQLIKMRLALKGFASSAITGVTLGVVLTLALLFSNITPMVAIIMSLLGALAVLAVTVVATEKERKKLGIKSRIAAIVNKFLPGNGVGKFLMAALAAVAVIAFIMIPFALGMYTSEALAKNVYEGLGYGVTGLIFLAMGAKMFINSIDTYAIFKPFKELLNISGKKFSSDFKLDLGLKRSFTNMNLLDSSLMPTPDFSDILLRRNRKSLKRERSN